MLSPLKRGRPKKTIQSTISNPVPKIEEFLGSSDDDDYDIGTFKQTDKILVGFESKVNKQKKIFSWPFDTKRQDKESILVEYKNKVDEYLTNIDEIFSNQDQVNKYDYQANEIFTCVLNIANNLKKSLNTLHAEICTKLINYVQSIPEAMKDFSDAIQIGEYWKQVSSKVKMVAISWSPLCQNEMNLPDFIDVFNFHLSEIFENSYDELFSRLSDIIVDAYSESRQKNDVSQIELSFEFVCHFKNKLFDEIFLPKLINSVMEYYKPILDEDFENQPLSEYLKNSIEIKEKEKALINSSSHPLIPINPLKMLENEFNMLIFGNQERLDIICKKKNLAPLIQQKDTESVRICADLARSTDKITFFARELSFEFESEAEECFKTENPIKSIMKLHLSLAEFDQSFNALHQRILRSAFEKGFNTSPDASARLLAEEVHREFIKEENDHKMCPQKTIDQLVAVFRMIASKDVFEEAHHLLLTRRMLMMKSHIKDADEYFADLLRDQCGPEYTKRFDALFRDLNDSISALSKFEKEYKSPAFFKALVVSNESWKAYPSVNPIEPPKEIKLLLESFAQFYSTKNGKKKLQWDFDFTRVKLNSHNLGLIKSINCSGTYATFLLMFNHSRVLCPDNIKKFGNFSTEQIDNILSVLKSRKCNHFILVMHDKIRINKDQFSLDVLQENNDDNDDDNAKNKFVKCLCFDLKSGVLSIPLIFPSFPKSDNDQHRNAIQSNRGMQVDAAVMKIMKQERSMEKIALKNTVKDLLNFRLEDEFFEKRLANLSKTLYLKLDPSGRVHYLT